MLDSIAWGLGGSKFEPRKAKRDGAMNLPNIDITLSNGIHVERKGKNSSLKVTDPSGQKAGQELLDEFVSEFALDLPKFMRENAKGKAQVLLQILGIGDQLTKLDQHEMKIYNQRHAVGQIADSKEKHAAELPEFGDAPDKLVSVSELIQSQQAILAKNGDNQRLRTKLAEIANKVVAADKLVAELEEKLATAKENAAKGHEALATAKKTVEQLQDESTAELETQLANIEAINSQVSANLAKAKAKEDSGEYLSQYNAKTDELEAVRGQRMALLANANLPLPGLTIEAGELLYNGAAWDCMAGSDQLRVATAIVRKLKPECEFVLIDKLEQMDIQTLSKFDVWLKSENLQVIATRVSTSEECTIIIEDGLPQGETYADVVTGVSTNGNGGNGKEEEWKF